MRSTLQSKPAERIPAATPSRMVQRQLHSLAAAPRILAQRKQLHAAFGPVIQRQGAPGEEELLQGKFAPIQRKGPEDEDLLQGRFESVQRKRAEDPESARANQTGLPDHLKAGVESLSGMSMDAVTVHRSSPRPAQLDALAFAQGTDIHVAPGQDHHLPHEAWHVVQQAQGRVKPTMQLLEGVPVNDDAGLEHEADVMGAKAGA
jgi:hypothetical protein